MHNEELGDLLVQWNLGHYDGVGARDKEFTQKFGWEMSRKNLYLEDLKGNVEQH